MGGVRGLKRKSPSMGDEGPSRHISNKKRKQPANQCTVFNHSLLDRIYPRVQTLREYLVQALPSSSRLRRKKIAGLRSEETTDGSPDESIEARLCHLLDTTLIASAATTTSHKDHDDRWEQWVSFSQKGDDSSVTLSGGLSRSLFSQSEIVDFVVWLLFSRGKPSNYRPKHILCDGFRTTAVRDAVQGISGLFALYPNEHVQILKNDPWPQLLMLLGQSGERIMINLLVDCAIFTAVKAGMGNLFQLSGEPIFDMATPLLNPADKKQEESSAVTPSSHGTLPSEISFVKSRMLYARAALSAYGVVQFGFRHIHILNRCTPSSCSPSGPETEEQLRLKENESTQNVMMYIFPRQFGLHNVFTSTVDYTMTAQKLQDYTMREDEIKVMRQRTGGPNGKCRPLKTPKRLRGEAFQMIRRLQTLHARCAYSELLLHYCPAASDAPVGRSSQQTAQSQATDTAKINMEPGTPRTHKSSRMSRGRSSLRDRRRAKVHNATPSVQFQSITDLATPVHQVSAFCQAVLSRIIPHEFWGSGNTGSYNRQIFLKKVDHFVRLRRYESMSLQEVRDGLKITSMGWLAPPGLKGQKTAASDMSKRLEILHEFLYYVFDSLLIPLIRSSFYVTETSTHRYRLFFFRHDVWRSVAEPSMLTLKSTMFEEVRRSQAESLLAYRKLGFSQLRLLPKGGAMRPIMNLKRRTVTSGNKTRLQASINSVLGPVYSVLKLEKLRNPTKLGASLFSIGDIYDRLKTFRTQLGPNHGKLYLVKVDVKSAFDTIPQESVHTLIEEVVSLKRYKFTKHAEVKAGAHKMMRRWHTLAADAKDETNFQSLVETSLAQGRRNTVFVDSALQRQQDADALLTLLKQHIQENIVKIGKKYFRQKRGIPQGSVVSSALCNYFYADLEQKHLGFLSSGDCLLLRLIDDFLLVTTDVSKARAFIQTMHAGVPDFGVTVNPAKTVANFDLQMDDTQIIRISGSQKLPYCGTHIDCRTLAISKNREPFKGGGVTEDGITVEFGHIPGHNFQRKVINAFKIQSHLMFYDVGHNLHTTVFENLFGSFKETAAKMAAYIRLMPGRQRPAPRIVLDTITRLIRVAYVLLTSKTRKGKHPGYVCGVSKVQVKWLALHAMKQTIWRRQTQYQTVLSSLSREIEQLASEKGIQDVDTIQRVVGL